MAGLAQPPIFGPGLAWVKNLTDINGATIAVPIPRRLPLVQEFSCDIDMPSASLYGENYFSIAEARKPAKVSGKVKFAGFNATPINSALLGLPGEPIPSGDQIAWDQLYTLASASLTIVPPSGGTYVEDLGVRFQSTGVALSRLAVGSSLITGQYTVNDSTGVCTFSAVDVAAGLTVAIDYKYTISTAVSQIVIAQEPLGNTPTFELTYRGVYRGLQVVAVFYNVISNKLALASKQDNWNMPELDYSCFEPTGIVGAPVARITFSQP